MDFSIIFLVVLAAIGIRVAFHFIDKSRIEGEVESRGELPR